MTFDRYIAFYKPLSLQQKITKGKDMNIKELFNLNGNVCVSISLADLREFVSELVVEAAAKPVKSEEKYLTTDEVCEILHVSSNTLWRWGKTGYLVPNKVGRTPMYRQSDIDNLRQGNNK